ncbi:MAG: bifunctional 4-hydroxy-2-oxoglutarate aldolase/2-dehydro-3-deoxy-phosphogluconate aldolase [Actinobacteria bacterium]|nr:bifunctional 4-hydroxy-2-oxoglutarate aldolase/2-dehydro-3-deoxy-phosphogluconate aldolase [Actinomycetota bacterium]
MSRVAAEFRPGPVIPVVTIARREEAVPLARAIAAGGLATIEVTLRSEVALTAIGEIAAAVPEIAVGAGTVRRPEQVDAAIAAGAAFLVTPATTPALLDALAASPVPVLPGVATASEVAGVLDRGIERMKLFPAAALGGTPLIGALAGPFPEARFCPTGGIDAGSAAGYLALANVLAVGGSWVADRDPERPDWSRVSIAARAAAALGGRRR